MKSPAKVLIVEDDALIRMATADMIGEIGFAAVEAANGLDALALLRDDGAIDTLLTDLSLPGMSGEELVGEARKLRPSLRVIIASGRLPASHGQFEGQAIEHLLKPFDIVALRKILGR